MTPEIPSLPNQLNKTDIVKRLINVIKYFGGVVIMSIFDYFMAFFGMGVFSLHDLWLGIAGAVVGAALDLYHRYKSNNTLPLLP